MALPAYGPRSPAWPVSVFDAHPGRATPGEPGTVALRRHGAVLVRTGDGALWIGHARRIPRSPTAHGSNCPPSPCSATGSPTCPSALEPHADTAAGGAEERVTARSPTERRGRVGVLTFDFYNGAMSTAQCHRLAAALRFAVAQDTAVLAGARR